MSADGPTYAFKTASVGLVLLDRNLRIARINEWLAANIGKPVEEQIGLTLAEAMPEIASQIFPGIEQTIDTREPVLGVEVTGPVPSAPEVQKRWLVSYYPMTGQDGQEMQISIVFQDVASHGLADGNSESAQACLDAVLLELPVGVAILEGPEFRYFRINRKLAEINGLAVEDHLGRPLAEVLPQAAADIVPGLQQVLEKGEPRLDREFSTRLPKDPDVTRHFIDSFFPVTGADGEPKAVCAVVLDITKRKHAEEALQKAHAVLEHRVKERTADLAESNAGLRREIDVRKKIEDSFQQQREELAHVLRTATVGELTAALAHEINQPLTAILLNATAAKRLMQDDKLDSQELGEILTDIIDDNRRAAEVIRRMRALLKKTKIDAQPLDINEVVDEVHSLIQSDAVIRKVAVDLELASDLPLVSGDRIQIQQVFLNLILNAFDAMNSVSVDDRRLLIQTALQSKDAIRVSIRDAGAGIGHHDTDRLFEAFHTTKKDGLGMGLAINRTIVEAHGGKIWASENPDQGATFQFTLPCL